VLTDYAEKLMPVDINSRKCIIALGMTNTQRKAFMLNLVIIG